MNKVILSGFLGKDAEVTTLKNDNSITKFSLATTNGYGDNKKTNWHNIIVWGEYGSKLAQYLTKGKEISLVGEIDYDTYEKDGVSKVYTTIIAREIEFHSSKGSNSGEVDAKSSQEPAKPIKKSSPKVEEKTPENFIPGADDDDLPF